ncbi:MAG: DctP family TRAP transporter solute-binding subunit [Rhizobiaceae bacterium]
MWNFASKALFGLALVALPGLFDPAAAQEEVQTRNLKMGMAVSTDSPWTQAALRFADAVSDASGGKITITVFPDGQLSNGNQVAEFELLQNGTIDFTYHSSIILSIIDARFALFSMPWIAPSNDALYGLMDGRGQEVWNGLDQVGVVSLGGYSTSGFRQLTNNRRAVTEPGHLDGLTLRVPGLKLYQSIFNAFRVDPVATSFGELYGALQQGVVDGQENPISTIYSARLHEIQDHMTIWNYSADSIGILTNQALWDDMSEVEKEILRDAADEAGIWHRQAQADSNTELLSEMERTLTVVRLTEEQIAEFRALMDPIYEEWKPVIGADLVDWAQERN